MKYLLFFSFISVFAIQAFTPECSYSQMSVVDGHPRIYIGSSDIDNLRVRVQDPDISVFYQQLKSRMDGTSSPHSNYEVAGFELESLALLHVVESSTSLYRNKMLNNWILGSYSAGSISHWQLPFQVIAHSIALDWLWDDISSSQRSDIGEVIVSLMEDLNSYGTHDIGANPSWANQMSDYSNQLYFHLGALAFAGIVLADEGINDERADYYLSEAYNLITNHMIPAMNQEAGGDSEMYSTEGFEGNGGWGEDIGHIAMTHPFFGQMIEAWRSGTGENFFPQINGLATINKYLFYMLRPGGGASPKGNANYQIGLNDKWNGVLGSLLSARYNDPYGKFLKDKVYQQGTYGFHQLSSVLWYNSSLDDLVYDEIPKSVYFRGQGEVVIRSGFDVDDTWVYFRSGPIYNGHQHQDQGNFLVDAYGGELVVEYAGDGNYSSEYHNTFNIDGGQTTYGSNQVQYVQPIENSEYAMGSITDYIQASSFTYASGAFGSAYGSDQISEPQAGKVTREIVSVMPDIIIVRDLVTSSHIPQFYLHAWLNNTTINNNNQTIEIRDGDGFCWIKSLLPLNGTISVQQQQTTDLIKVVPSMVEDTQEFLHMFYLSPSNDRFIPSTVQLIENGVLLVDENNTQWEVIFNDGETGLNTITQDGTIVYPNSNEHLTPIIQRIRNIVP